MTPVTSPDLSATAGAVLARPREKLKAQVGPGATLVITLLFAAPTAFFAYRAVLADLWLGYPLFSLIWVPAALLLVLPLKSALVALSGELLEVSIDAGALQLGGSAEVVWRAGPGAAQLRKLELRLLGELRTRSSADDDDGHKLERQVFYRQRLQSFTDPMLIRAGSTRLRIPGELMHSLDGAHNQVCWTLELVGNNRLGNAVVFDEYSLNVLAPSVAAPGFGLGLDQGRFTCAGDPGLSIRLVPDRAAFGPGEVIKGLVIWDLGPETARHGLRLDLRWQTRGAGDKDEAVLTMASFSPQSGRGEADFAFPLPTQPYSLQGKHLSIDWRLELAVEDSHRRCQGLLVIAPAGRAVVLPAEDRRSWIPGAALLLLAAATLYALFQVPVDTPRQPQGGPSLLALLMPEAAAEPGVEEPALECARGPRTSLHQRHRPAALPPRHDQAPAGTTLLLRPLSGNEPLWSEELDGRWRCLAPGPSARGYLIGSVQQRGAWLPLSSVLYLPEDGSGVLPSAMYREEFLAMAALSSPGGRYLAFVGGRNVIDGLYVLDVQRDEVRKLGPAPAPPPRPAARSTCADQPLVWGGCWADGLVELEPEILRFVSEDVLEASYAKDGPGGRATTRNAKRFNLNR